jgi:hypothetical protein
VAVAVTGHLLFLQEVAGEEYPGAFCRAIRNRTHGSEMVAVYGAS